MDLAKHLDYFWDKVFELRAQYPDRHIADLIHMVSIRELHTDEENTDE